MKKVVLFFALAVGLLASATMMAQNVLLHETFDTVELDQGGVLSLINLPTGWTRIDADNDGNNWFIFGKIPDLTVAIVLHLPRGRQVEHLRPTITLSPRR